MPERTVPAYVPRFEDANMIQGWDYARPERPAQAEMWAALIDYKDRAMVESAARMLCVAGDAEHDLAGLLALLWGFTDEEDAHEFVDQNRAAIEERAAELTTE